MGWHKEYESPIYQEYFRRRIEEEAQHYAQYLEQKAVSDFECYVETRKREEMKKAAASQR
ncbi:MAG TPA: hypothetical protein GX506_01000 [Firmicutes bacterium]|nr:hypothetical protein [Bacillota bacterium]